MGNSGERGLNTEDNHLGGPGAVRIEALRYRSLRYVSQNLKPFHVLVGPNASGKSNFLDVPAFLGDLLLTDLETAFVGDERLNIPLRTTDAPKLTWMGQGRSFELAIEMAIPEDLRQGRLYENAHSVCRYEIAVDVSRIPQLVSETLWLLPSQSEPAPQAPLFPMPSDPPRHIVQDPGNRAPTGWTRVVFRNNDPELVTYRTENTRSSYRFRIPRWESALASLPADGERFPVALWFRRTLRSVQPIVLSSEAMRQPSPPIRRSEYLPDGSNLPHVVRRLETRHPEWHGRWIEHVREALPDIVGVSTSERPEDRHRYLVLKYKNGLEAPSWLVSDGTLRLLALTLLAYLPDVTGTYLIEEPENGVHPQALETVFQSLSSVYNAQVLLTTHSPLIARLTSLDQLLCLARSEEAGTDIVAGRFHPVLQDWQGTADLGVLLASGVLG